MTTKKAPKNEINPKPGIQINRSRGGGKKKPDLFANFRNTEHPLDNLLPPLDAQQEKLLDAQQEKSETPNGLKVGRPTDELLGVKTPNNESWTPNSTKELGVKTPNNNKLDAQLAEKPNKKEKRKIWESHRTTDRLALRPNTEILRKFKLFCVEKNLNLTEFFEMAGLKLIELDAQQVEKLGVLTPLDDRRLKIMFKSRPLIINLYLRYNSIFNELTTADDGKKWSARWTSRDDEAAVRYNNVSATIVELGILQTQIQKGFRTSRIQTFKYYTDEIEKVLTSGASDEMLETILKYHRQLWTNQTGREVNLEFLEKNE